MDITRSVRVRAVSNKKMKHGLITIKGIGDDAGISRYEFETKISIGDALDLLKLCDLNKKKKTRYHYNYMGFLWEIDECHKENSGLLIAEIELTHMNQTFPLPAFIDREVTGQKKYYNSMLVKNPFESW